MAIIQAKRISVSVVYISCSLLTSFNRLVAVTICGQMISSCLYRVHSWSCFVYRIHQSHDTLLVLGNRTFVGYASPSVIYRCSAELVSCSLASKRCRSLGRSISDKRIMRHGAELGVLRAVRGGSYFDSCATMGMPLGRVDQAYGVVCLTKQSDSGQ